MTVIAGAWQCRHAARPNYRWIAALGLSAIRLLAGVLGVANRIVSYKHAFPAMGRVDRIGISSGRELEASLRRL
jgi:hypothetical protein